MKIAGLICDYNRNIDETIELIHQAKSITQSDILILIMAGHFTQRGEPTYIDKWQRTSLALNQGIDLVIELPYAYATQNPNEYAKAAVELLKLAECNTLVFESETNNLEELQVLADCSFRINSLIEKQASSIPYPDSYGYQLGAYFPNDILALAYLRAIKSNSITPNSIQAPLPRLLRDPKSMNQGVSWNDYYPYLRLKLQTLPADILNSIFLVDEGLINHLIEQSKNYATYDEFMMHAIKRRYTKQKIQRALVHILTHTSQADILNLSELNYLRVLGFNKTGQIYLKQLKLKEIKVVSRFNQIPLKYRAMEYKATLSYAFALNTIERDALIQREIEEPVIV